MSFVIEPAYTHANGQKAKVYLQTMDGKSAIFFDAIDRQKLATYNLLKKPDCRLYRSFRKFEYFRAC